MESASLLRPADINPTFWRYLKMQPGILRGNQQHPVALQGQGVIRSAKESTDDLYYLLRLSSRYFTVRKKGTYFASKVLM